MDLSREITKQISDLRANSDEAKILKFSGKVLYNCTIEDLHQADVSLTFEDCIFEKPLELQNCELKDLTFSRVMFAGVEKTISIHDPDNESVTKPVAADAASLDLTNGRLRSLQCVFTGTAPHDKILRIVGTRSNVAEKVLLRRMAPSEIEILKKNNSETNEITLCEQGSIRFENAYIGQDFRCMDQQQAGANSGLFFNFAHSRIDGGMFISSPKEREKLRISLNAENLRVQGQLQLMNFEFFWLDQRKFRGNAQYSTLPALSLRFAQIGTLEFIGNLKGVLDAPEEKNLEPWAFESRISVNDNRPGLRDFTISEARLNSEDTSNLKDREDFWEKFSELSQTDKNSRRQYIMLARALERGGDRDSSDRLLSEESLSSITDRLNENSLFGKIPYVSLGGFGLIVLKKLARLFLLLVFSLMMIFVLAHMVVDSFYSGETKIIEKLEPITDIFSNYIRIYIYPIFIYVLKFISILIVVLLAFIFSRLLLPKSNRNVVGAFKAIFDYLSHHTIRGGLEPLAVVSYVFALWLFGSLVFSAAMYLGYMAPDESDVSRAEYELLLLGKAGHMTGKNSEARHAFYQGCWIDNDRLEMQPPKNLRGEPKSTDREKIKDQIKKIPLIAFHTACRANWAIPDKIPQNLWKEKIIERLKQRKDVNQSLPYHNKSCICERFLPAEYSTFYPMIYAADVVIPLLNLRLEEQWSIRISEPHSGETKPLAVFFLIVEVIMVVMGWVFALVLAGALSGLADPTRRPY